MKILSQLKKMSLATVAIAVISGILFLAFPDLCIKYISLFVGGTLIVVGIIGIINYLIDRASTVSLVMGIILAVIGIVVCARYRQIISVIIIIVGVFMLMTGVFNFFTSIKVITSKMHLGWFSFILSVVTVVLGIICVTRSGDTSLFIARFIGASLIVYAVLDIVTYIQVRKLVKDIKDESQPYGDIETQAQVIEDIDE